MRKHKRSISSETITKQLFQHGVGDKKTEKSKKYEISCTIFRCCLLDACAMCTFEFRKTVEKKNTTNL